MESIRPPFGYSSAGSGCRTEPGDLAPYLASSPIIEADTPAVAAQARRLAKGGEGEFGVIRRCFEWVSNHIPHSRDCGADTVPCTAGEVLLAGHGLCYAKSHLFAALLRANGIPAGFDYQRLGSRRDGYGLHGLNRVYLAGHSRWLRLDPRGRAGAVTRLAGPEDHLIFSGDGPGELDYGLNLPEPDPGIVRLLRRENSIATVLGSLPASVSMG